MGVLCEYFEKNWPRCNGTALFNPIAVSIRLQGYTPEHTQIARFMGTNGAHLVLQNNEFDENFFNRFRTRNVLQGFNIGGSKTIILFLLFLCKSNTMPFIGIWSKLLKKF